MVEIVIVLDPLLDVICHLTIICFTMASMLTVIGFIFYYVIPVYLKINKF